MSVFLCFRTTMLMPRDATISRHVCLDMCESSFWSITRPWLLCNINTYIYIYINIDIQICVVSFLPERYFLNCLFSCFLSKPNLLTQFLEYVTISIVFICFDNKNNFNSVLKKKKKKTTMFISFIKYRSTNIMILIEYM